MHSTTWKLAITTIIVLATFSAVECRERQKPLEEIRVERIRDGPPCTLDVNKNIVEPQPLFLQPGSTEFWPVEPKGVLEIPRGTDIELHCTQGFQLRPQQKSINATCLEDRTFLVNREKTPFSILNCTSQVKYRVRETKVACAINAKLYEVGFNVSVNRFVKTLDICHDETAVNTLWTLSKLDPANVHFQGYVQRLNFSKAGFFGKRNMNHLYSKAHQKQVFESLLGPGYVRYFDNSSHFLSRGHISSKTEHIFGTQQRATFTFFNTAPQWQTFNAGTWNAVESGLRKFVASRGNEVQLFSGTWGVMSLPNANGQPTNLYLSYDENKNGEIPVPKLFFKVLVNTTSRPQRGIVLIGVNNPYINITDLYEDYLICNDISESVPWIRWRRDNINKGYFFACEVNEFLRVVDYLPKSLENVRAILV